eukprot:10702947-Lingulodinium_polyedra.AAC.1
MAPQEMPDGIVQDMPQGCWCLLCSTTAEVWPLMAVEAVVEQYKKVPNFRVDFNAARQKVADNRSAQGTVRRETVS